MLHNVILKPNYNPNSRSYGQLLSLFIKVPGLRNGKRKLNQNIDPFVMIL